MNANEEVDRNKFMEGASWMARKALTENQAALNRVERSKCEFNDMKRRSELHGSGLFASKNEEWLVEQVEGSLKNNENTLKSMLEDATKKQTTAQREIDFLARQY